MVGHGRTLGDMMSEMSEIRVILYSTDHCTLCEQALDLLLSMPELAGRQLDVVDVAEDDALLSRYGERLPVLCVTSGARRDELAWPFDAKSIAVSIRQSE